MITALIQIKIADAMTVERAKEVFLTTAPRYKEARGLIRKYYLLSEDGGTVGGAYLWNSKSDAEGFYTTAWKKFVLETYGAEPVITYFHSPVVVDNLLREIIQD